MNFAQVKGITIPQGAVKQLSQGQTTLWKKSGGVPIGYRRLTGIEFDGNVWYDTNMYLQGSDTLKFAFEASVACNVLGCYTDASAQTNFSLYVSTSGTAKYLRYNGGTYNSSITANTRYDVILTPTGSDGMKVDSTWTAKTFTTPTTMMIGTTSVGATSAKLTGALYGDIEVVGREKLIPVKRASDGAIGYWMESAGVFLANLGTGIPVPTGYIDPYDVQVEYLQSDGQAYIDLGFKATQNISFILEVYRPSNSVRWDCGAEEGWSSRITRLLIEEGTNKYVSWRFGTAGTPTTIGTSNCIGDLRLRVNGKNVSIDNLTTEITYNSAAPTANAFTTPGNFLLFGVDVNGAAATSSASAGSRFKTGTITDSAVDLDLIAVRIGQDGYLYDRNSGTLFGNAGGGSFILGNDINASA